MPTSNSSDSWIGNFAKFTDKGLCGSFECSDLLAKSPVRMTDKKYWGFLGCRNFYRYQLQILGNFGDFFKGGGGNGRGGFCTPVRGTMFVRNGAVTPGPSCECDITFFVKGRPKCARQSRDSAVTGRRVQSVTVPSSRVSRECRSLVLRSPPLKTPEICLVNISVRMVTFFGEVTLTVGAFLLTVKLLCLQSLKALIRRTSHCKQRSSNCKKKS